MRHFQRFCLFVLIAGTGFATADEIHQSAAVEGLYADNHVPFTAGPLQRRYGAIEQAELDPSSRFVVTTPTPWSSPPAAYAGLGYGFWGYGPRLAGCWFGYGLPYRYGYYPDYWRFGPYRRYRPFPLGEAYTPYYGLHREWLHANLQPPMILPPFPEEPAHAGVFYW